MSQYAWTIAVLTERVATCPRDLLDDVDHATEERILAGRARSVTATVLRGGFFTTPPASRLAAKPGRSRGLGSHVGGDVLPVRIVESRIGAPRARRVLSSPQRPQMHASRPGTAGRCTPLKDELPAVPRLGSGLDDACDLGGVNAFI